MSIPGTREREHEANQHIAVKASDNLATDFAGHNEQSHRHYIDIRILPDFLLQSHTGLKLFYSCALPENNIFLRHLRMHAHFCATPVFERCQSSSICSKVSSSSFLFFFRLSASIRSKRSRNFLLVPRNEDSRSTFRYRATFTTVKNRSPTSSSIGDCSSSR